MGKLRSNRVRRVPQTGITSDRYEYLGLNQAEPNLGDPRVGPSSVGVNPIKAGAFYQLAAIAEYPGERFWSTQVGIGSTLGVISVYANDVLPNSAFERIHGLNFVGTGVTIETPPLELFDGIGIATIRFTVTDILNQGQVGQLLYNGPSGRVNGISDAYYVAGNVGFGSTIPQYKLDVNGDVQITGNLSDGNSTGTLGQYLSATGTGITWSSFPTLRVGYTTIATTGQTGFSTTYTPGFVDFYLNGVRLNDSDFVATNGTTITLNTACFGGEVVDILAYNTITTGVGGSGGGTTIIQTGTSYWSSNASGINTTSNVGIGTTNASSALTVSGDGNFTGVVTATAFYGDGSGLTNLPGTSGGESYWVKNSAGIHTLSNVGIGTTNPQVSLEINGVLGFNDTNVKIGNNLTGCSITSGTYNNFIGVGAGYSLTDGDNNNFFGKNAGIYSVNGCNNNFFGQEAGSYNTGNYNNFFGCASGFSNTSGNSNNFFGVNAGHNNTTGSCNNFFGDAAGYWNTTGDYNNFFGIAAGSNNDNGCYNNFFGYNAGCDNISGNNNNFFGYFAGCSNTTGNYNIFIGDSAGSSNTAGEYNNFFGVASGWNNTIGCYNNFFGIWAGCYNTIGSHNNAFGNRAGNCNDTGNHNTFLGNYTGIYTSASYRLILGEGLNSSNAFDVPKDADTQFAVGVRTDTNPSKYWLVGNENFNIGIGATNPQTRLEVDGIIGFTDDGVVDGNIRIGDSTTGANLGNAYDNIFLGVGAGNSTTIGDSNNFFGFQAGYCNESGHHNNFIGCNAGYENNSGSCNNFFGPQAGNGNYDGYYNNFIGPNSGNVNSTGHDNNFFGYFAGHSNTSGSYNNFIGNRAGDSNTTGSNNTFFGRKSGYFNVDGNYNLFYGFYSGYQNYNGNYNLFFGASSGWLNSTGSYNIYLGNNNGLSASASCKIIIGNSSSYGYFDSPNTTKDLQFAVGVKTDTNPSKYWLVGNENFNIGIGTTNPTSKLTVGGDASISGVVTATTFFGNLSGTATTATYSTTTGYASTAGIATVAQGLTGTPNLNVGIVTATKLTTSGDLDVTGITRIKNFAETQSTSSISSNILSLDANQGTVFTHTTSAQIGIVSFTGISTARANTQTFTVLVTQGAVAVNTTSATGIGTQLATIVTDTGVGINTHIKVGSGTTITLTNSAGALDVLTFIISYNGVGVANTNFTIVGFAATNFRGVI